MSAGRRALLAGLLALVAGPAALAASAGARQFADATPGSGIVFKNVCGAVGEEKGWLTEGMGAGAAWLDYDGDGNLDLYLVNGSTHARPAGRGEGARLYRGDGKGRFTDVTARAGAGGSGGWSYGVTVGDYDNDGDPDLFVTQQAADLLLRNNGDGTFTDVTKAAGVSDDRWSTSAAFFDAERDGDLDLYVGNYMVSDPAKVPGRASPAAMSVYCTYRGTPVFCGPLGQTAQQDSYYRNNGDGTFTEATQQAGFWLAEPRYALGVVTGDYDNDGDTDVYVANDSVPASLWKNRGDGTFVDVGLETLAALNANGRPQAGMGTDFGDYNDDGWLDIVVTNFSHDIKCLYRNVGGQYFLDESAAAGMGVTYLFLSWGTGFYDFDHDADQDLFIANGHVYPHVDRYDLGTRYRQPNHLFDNRQGKFVEVSAEAGPGFAVKRSFRGTAFGDYDNDGDVDLLVTALDDAPLLLRNDGAPKGHWLEVQLVGQRSNRDGIGARVSVVAGGKRQIRERKGGGSYLSASDPRLHFGLGAATRIDTLEVQWPSGAKDLLTGIPADRAITIREGSTRKPPPR